MSKTRFIIVVGGVMSGIGKGVVTASLGALLKAYHFSVQIIKCDPYINLDAGTMNPFEHGEVFVTDDGTECDQDIGNYERFLNQNCSTYNLITTGRVYYTVIKKERQMRYGGKCVEVIPHIPYEIMRRIYLVRRIYKPDFILIEIGGTVGEYQNSIFLEAIRLLKIRHPDDVFLIMVSYLPIPKTLGEMKTKPTQYSVRTLNETGLMADMIIGRSEKPLDLPRKRKISIFCNVPISNVISCPDTQTSIYEVPLILEKENVTKQILRYFKITKKKPNLKLWQNFLNKKIASFSKEIKIGIVGKYFEIGDFALEDSYISVIEALKHAAFQYRCFPKISWINSEDFEKNPAKTKILKHYDGIIVPGGFGKRGAEGKINAIKFVRENNIPYLGLCYGMQLACVEFARNVLKLYDANTTEIDLYTKNPVIDILLEQKINIRMKNYGASMRLGSYDCLVKEGTLAFQLYQQKLIKERHRHRYEFNNLYLERFKEKGMIFSGINPQRNLVEIIELKNHPFFIGVQFHPELRSRPLNPHPLFMGFIKSVLKE